MKSGGNDTVSKEGESETPSPLGFSVKLRKFPHPFLVYPQRYLNAEKSTPFVYSAAEKTLDQLNRA